MKNLESAAALGIAEPWELEFSTVDGCEVLSTRSLMQTALEKVQHSRRGTCGQSAPPLPLACNLARGRYGRMASGSHGGTA